MKYPTFSRRHLAAFAAFGGLFSPLAAQTAPKAPALPSAPADASAPLVLSAFEVNAESDRGYLASSAMSATRTNEKLENLPNSISVMTQDLLQDLAITDYFGAVDFAVGAENIYNDQGTIGSPVGNRGGNQISFRGFASIRQLRDGFEWFMPQDVYNTERIEFNRGAGGLAYGDVDPGGIINVGTKRAGFGRKGSAQFRTDTYGSRRASLDLTQPLLRDRLGVRLNLVESRIDSVTQRKDRSLTGVAGAIRWEPFTHRRTQIDAVFERGDTVNRLGHLQLNDHASVYRLGTGTNALDGNPNLAGVQANGPGMRQIVVNANGLRSWFDLGGKLHDMSPTPTAVFRTSFTNIAAAAATGTDPQNPERILAIRIPYSIMPLYEDWGGPNLRHDSVYDVYTVELKHAFTGGLSVLAGYNHQKDDAKRLQTYASNGWQATNSRGVFIDVNRVLPNPDGPGTIPNPRFEKYFVTHIPSYNRQRHDIDNWRAMAVYDARARLPLLGDFSQRMILNGTYRHELYGSDDYNRSLSPAEIAARRAANPAVSPAFNRNEVVTIHYLEDGNSEEKLRITPLGNRFAYYRTGGSRFDQTLGSASFSAVGRYLGGRLHSSVGISRDYFRSNRNAANGTDPVTGETFFTGTSGARIPAGENPDVPVVRFSRLYGTNQTYGGVYRILPWLGIGAGYFESSLFTDSNSSDLLNRPRAQRTGEGTDYSLRFGTPDGRLAANLTYFSTVSENQAVAISGGARDELNNLLSPSVGQPAIPANGDYRDQTSSGVEFELVGNVMRNLTLRGTYSYNSVINVRFFPLVRPFLAAAQTAARARGLDPDLATQITQDFLEAQENNLAKNIRRTANLVARYSFTQGALRGVAAGAAARWTAGRPRGALGGVATLPATTMPDFVVVNPFVSYRTRIGKLGWSFQLNVNNVFNDDTDSGNSYTWTRYTEPRHFISTVSVEF
ncbi:MAG: TonB-dependent receptor plug domain-containing protein [Opitutaceae bacterium]|mgnify:CR=1 FL=1|nr:TonB-dependent receptor plug domain-containing protein [Opitutaceae bacterium]